MSRGLGDVYKRQVYVNGERIDGEHRLQNNDTLRIGKTTVRLVL